MRIALHAPPRGTPVSVDALAEHIFETAADLFVAPEYFVQDISPFQNKSGDVELAPIEKSRKDEFVESLAEKTKDFDTLIIPGSIIWHAPRQPCKNSAPVIYKGEVIGERYKEHEAETDKDIASLVGKKYFGKKSDASFEHDGVAYRLDICLDVLEQTDVNEYDVHIVICSRMHGDLFGRVDYSRARQGGVFAVVDNGERKGCRRLGKPLTKPFDFGNRFYHMPLVAQSFEHTDVFEVER